MPALITWLSPACRILTSMQPARRSYSDRNAGQKSVVVPAGVYNIPYPFTNAGAYHLALTGMSNFDIDATGATLIFRSECGPEIGGSARRRLQYSLSVYECRRLSLGSHRHVEF